MAEEDIPDQVLLIIKESFSVYSRSDKENTESKLEEALSLKTLEKSLGEHEKGEVIKSLDLKDNPNQQVSWEMFLAAVVRGMKLQRLNDVFKSYDLDNDGFITKDEIKKGMRRYNQTITNEEAEKIIVDMGDINKDGKIDFKEFSAGYL